MSCIIKSVTLQANETFVLPPGAELIAATDVNLITVSPVECAPTDNLETLKCYAFRFSGQMDHSGSPRKENWEGPGDSNFIVSGITVNDIYYPFSSSIEAWQNSTSWSTALNSIVQFSGIFTNITSVFGYDSTFLGASRGWTTLVTLKTIPSIANNMLIKISTLTNDQGSVPDDTYTVAYVKGDLTTCPPIPPTT